MFYHSDPRLAYAYLKLLYFRMIYNAAAEDTITSPGKAPSSIASLVRLYYIDIDVRG